MGRSVTLALPSRMNFSTLPALARAWPQNAAVVRLDFSEQRFVYPSGTVGLACLVEKALRAGQAIQVATGPYDNSSYWSRMGFFDLFQLAGAPLGGGKRAPDGRFAELCRASDLYQVDEISEALVDVLQPDGEGRNIFSHILTEALNNVCQHSMAVGFCAAQLYPSQEKVRLCIADCGRGLKESLGRHSPRDDQHAVELALQVGISGPNPAAVKLRPHALRNRGVGLSVAQRLVEANGGRMRLWSGSGAYPEPPARDPAGHFAAWQGTLIAINMPRQQFVRRSVDILSEINTELEGRKASAPRRLTRLP